MPTVSQIIKADAQFVRDSGFVLETHYTGLWVSLVGQDEAQVVFLQGDEADQLNDEAWRLYESVGDITIEDARLHLLKPHVECLH